VTGRRLALGLMSGTSCDGVDAALVETDGLDFVHAGEASSFDYPREFRRRLRAALGHSDAAAALAAELTDRHADAVRALLAKAGVAPMDVAVVGFHGQTILHEPERHRTLQIGDGARLAKAVGIDVVNDLRAADMAAGGEGAPLAPLYHRALAVGLEKPLAVLNLGGVGNVTWIGEDRNGAMRLLAFDTGPGNALIDDWAMLHTGEPVDRDGRLAKAGVANASLLGRLLVNPYFARPAPKSLDRDAFDVSILEGLSAADGAATLVAFTAATVARGAQLFPEPVKRWLVTGGGRQNPAIMAELRRRLERPVEPVEAVDWNGDQLEAQAFAYLAVRSLEGLPLSLPETTGVRQPTTGGRLHRWKS
jgi:anhydro-N-acetylmuramic acid kinase